MSVRSRLDSVVAAKEALIREAEELAAMTEFRGGHQRAQALMQRWKAAGRAGPANDELWHRFKAALDRFYTRMREQRHHPSPNRTGPTGARPRGARTPEERLRAYAARTARDLLSARVVPHSLTSRDEGKRVERSGLLGTKRVLVPFNNNREVLTGWQLWDQMRFQRTRSLSSEAGFECADERTQVWLREDGQLVVVDLASSHSWIWDRSEVRSMRVATDDDLHLGESRAHYRTNRRRRGDILEEVNVNLVGTTRPPCSGLSSKVQGLRVAHGLQPPKHR